MERMRKEMLRARERGGEEKIRCNARYANE